MVVRPLHLAVFEIEKMYVVNRKGYNSVCGQVNGRLGL